MRVQKIDTWDAIQDYNSVTILTKFGKFLPESKIYQAFEPYFYRATIKYFDIDKSIKEAGYLNSDLHIQSCEKVFKGNYTCLLKNDFTQESLWKSPDSEDFIVNCEIRIDENRRYDFWWDYVRSMKTTKKKLSGKLTLRNHDTYKAREICLYHPQISYQRNGMNNLFYNDNILNYPVITNKQLVAEHIDK